MRPSALLLLVLVLASTEAQAGLLRPTVVEVPLQRVGDVLRYRGIIEPTPILGVFDGGDVLSDVVVRVEASDVEIVDRYGIPRRGESYRAEHYSDGEMTSSSTCHALRGSRETLLHDVHLRRPSTTALEGREPWVALALSSLRHEASVAQSFHPKPCDHRGRDVLAGTRLTEGARRDIADFLPGLADVLGFPPLASAPAEATRWNGRPALVFRFDVSPLWGAEDRARGAGGSIDAIVADGLPSYAALRAEWREADGTKGSAALDLVAYVPAPAGAAALAPLTDARLPERNPSADFSPANPLVLDDAALDLAYPFEEAFASLMGDPTLGLAAWLAERPDAVLAYARYDRRMEDRVLTDLTTDGGWDLVFVAGDGQMSVRTFRFTWGPLDFLGAPKMTRNRPEPAEPVEVGDSTEPVADSRSLRATLRARGLPEAGFERLEYRRAGSAGPRPGPALLVSEVSLEDTAVPVSSGRAVLLDMRLGAPVTVFDETVQSDILAPLPLPGSSIPARATAFTPLDVPPAGVGLAVVAGLALVALLVKILLAPLYTRLVRARLLDHPVRARLLERIRTEPGVHRAALIELAGVGNGATRHHLRQLEKHGLVHVVDESGRARYFASGAFRPDEARRQSVLAAGSHRAVYELYVREPDASLRKAARDLGMSAPSVHRAKRKLERAGLLPARASAEDVP